MALQQDAAEQSYSPDPPSLASFPGSCAGSVGTRLSLTWSEVQTMTRFCIFQGTCDLVSEPDPQKIEKEGLVNQLGWKCTLRPV